MPKEEYTSLSEEEKKFLAKGPAPPKKTIFRLQIPFRLRTALIFTIFFAIIGIVLQSIDAGRFVFVDFFGSNFADWVRSLGGFTRFTTYPSIMALLVAIASKWYYFFYTGGLISLIWTFITSLINSEIKFTAKAKETK